MPCHLRGGRRHGRCHTKFSEAEGGRVAEVRGHYSQGRLSGQAKVGFDAENIILSNRNI